jgi:hypothetical protein
MHSRTARAMHSATNMAYWLENPDWSTGNRLADVGLQVYRKLPFSTHEVLKGMFFATDQLLAVHGESVVMRRGSDAVDKFMLRRPGKMALEAFHANVSSEVGAVTRHLAGIALPTSVSIQSAHIFRNPRTHIDAVTQTQPLLDLTVHVPLRMQEISTSTPNADRTAEDLEALLDGSEQLLEQHGFYADTGSNGGNLRRSTVDGSVTLIDVMPFYATGSRLIGDNPSNVIEHIEQNLAAYREFVGQYGS